MHVGSAMSRRTFLARCATFGGATLAMSAMSQTMAFMAGSRPRFLTGGGEIMLDQVTRSDFAAEVGTQFTLRLDEGGTVRLELIKVTPGPACAGPAGAPAREPFAIVFRSAPDVRLPQRIYRIEHDRMGGMNVFIVPIGPDDRGMRFEAVFG